MKLLLALLTLGASMAFADTLAYTDPTGVGNQSWTGALGMDFNVNAPILISGLGAFDSSQDGFSGRIEVQIYDRTTGLVVPGLDILITSVDGLIIGGDRVVGLSTPVALSAGFQGSIVASGFSASDQNGNSGGATNFSVLDTGAGLISFVGTSRYDNSALVFPSQIDGAVARYGAGTFTFGASASEAPEPGTLSLLGGSLIVAALYSRKRLKS